MIKLSLLIPCTTDRLPMLGNLLAEFEKQLPEQTDKKFTSNVGYDIYVNTYGEIEIIICMDNKVLTIGAKRNILMDLAKGEYVAGFDSDDLPSDCYIEEVMKGIEKGVDACSLNGVITTDGKDEKIFKHYIACEKYDEVDNVYIRFQNHLNAIKRSIASQFKFPEKNWGEDTDWAVALHDSGLIKTEHTIEPIIYYYKYVSNK